MSKKNIRNSHLNLEDIARLSGVSRSTVSRVVNRHPNVNDKTRARVLEVIQEHGFKPNPAARALASQHLHVIGILIPHAVTEIFTDPFFPLLIQAVTTSANHHGYSVTLWLASAEMDRLTFYDQVFNPRLADGLIVASAVVDYPFLDKLDSLGKPYILVGRPNLQNERMSYVDVDSEYGAYLLAHHLIEQGRQHIGMIPGLRALTSGQDREEGFRKALREANMDTNLVSPPGNYTEQGGYTGMRYLLEQGVDAVFATSDIMAVGALRAIHEAGLRVPEDIALGGFDDMPFAAVSTPPLTTIRQPINQLGMGAVEGLMTLFTQDDDSPYQRIYPIELVVRKSSVL